MITINLMAHVVLINGELTELLILNLNLNGFHHKGIKMFLPHELSFDYFMTTRTKNPITPTR